jgi:hypothetical protein
VEIIEQQAVVRESEYKCHHCEGELPALDFTIKIPQRGPVLLTAEKGSTKGIFDRSQAWYCICCAVNHPYGAEVRKEVLRQGWGRLLAWKPGGIRGPEVKPIAYLSNLMHRAAAQGAANALPWLSAAGLEYGDLWVLSKSQRVALARMTQGEFPIERPKRLVERERWSGPLLIQSLSKEDSGLWLDICQATFVALESNCWGPPRENRIPVVQERTAAPEPDPMTADPDEVEAGVDVDILIDGEEPVVPVDSAGGDEGLVLVQDPNPFSLGGFGGGTAVQNPAGETAEEAPPGVDEEMPPDF